MAGMQNSSTSSIIAIQTSLGRIRLIMMVLLTVSRMRPIPKHLSRRVHARRKIRSVLQRKTARWTRL